MQFVQDVYNPRLQDFNIDSKKTLASNQQHASAPAAEKAQQSRLEQELSAFAQHVKRQVPELPNGTEHLNLLLRHVDKLKAQAAGASGKQKAAYEAYLNLSLVDLLADAWQQRKKMLEQSLDVTVAQVSSSSSSSSFCSFK